MPFYDLIFVLFLRTVFVCVNIIVSFLSFVEASKVFISLFQRAGKLCKPEFRNDLRCRSQWSSYSLQVPRCYPAVTARHLSVRETFTVSAEISDMDMSSWIFNLDS